MRPNLEETVDFVRFTKEKLNGKRYFLTSAAVLPLGLWSPALTMKFSE